MKLVSFFLLLAGAGTNSAPASGGALAFAADCSPLWANLNYGSAFIYIMLLAGANVNSDSACGALSLTVDVPPSYALWVSGSAFIYIMLIAGASARNPLAIGGALTFRVDISPSNPWLNNGSAKKI